MLSQMTGTAAVGHVLYAVGGMDSHTAVQPLLFHFGKRSFAVCLNGSLTNAKVLRKRLDDYGSIFQTTCNAEILAHIIKRTRHITFVDSVKRTLSQIEGGFAALFMTQTKMIAARDPYGLRPLVIGKLGESYVVTSETCAIEAIGAIYIRDVEPGEIITIDNDGLKSEFYTDERAMRVCAMEYVYIARPDSNIEEINVHTTRKRAGKILAKESPTKADVVIASPDTAISAALGYAEESGIPYEIGIVRNRYIGRTFIAPEQVLREQAVKMKLSAVRSIVEGKTVILVDDSLVRGTTSRHNVKLLRDAGAKEVHIKVASPLFKHPCFYGIDLPSAEELAAHNRTAEELAKKIGVDSLAFISVEGLEKAVGMPPEHKCSGLCMACFNGQYPTDIGNCKEGK
jgi:amidophosphoribosyltransferase